VERLISPGTMICSIYNGDVISVLSWTEHEDCGYVDDNNKHKRKCSMLGTVCVSRQIFKERV